MGKMSDKDVVEKLKQEHLSPETKKVDVPTEIITLPSKGHFYPVDHPLTKGEIELKYPTAREEDIITSRGLIQKIL